MCACAVRCLRLARHALCVPVMVVRHTLDWRHAKQCSLCHFRWWHHAARSKATAARSVQSHHATGLCAVFIHSFAPFQWLYNYIIYTFIHTRSVYQLTNKHANIYIGKRINWRPVRGIRNLMLFTYWSSIAISAVTSWKSFTCASVTKQYNLLLGHVNLLGDAWARRYDSAICCSKKLNRTLLLMHRWVS